MAAIKRLTLPAEGNLSTDRNDAGNWTGGSVGVGDLKGTKFGISATTQPTAEQDGRRKAVQQQRRPNRYAEI